MVVENLLKIIKEDALKDINKVISDAKAQEEKILEDAEKKAEQIKRRHMEQSEKKLKVDRAMILNDATLTAKREVNKAKEDVIGGVFLEAKSELKEIRKSKEYERVLQRFIEETKKEIDSKWTVKANAEDKKLLRRLFDSNGIEYEMADNSQDISDGFIIVSGKITVYNNFESRLQKLKKFILPELNAILFG